MSEEPIVFWACIVAPTALFLVTVVLYWRTRRFLARAVRVSGTIVSVSSEQNEVWRGQGEGSETVTTYYAHVRFAGPDGTPVEFRSASLTQRPADGQTVTVAYDPAHPAGARIDDGIVWRWTAVSGGFAAIVFVVCAWMLIGDERRGGQWTFLTAVALAVVAFSQWLGKRQSR